MTRVFARLQPDRHPRHPRAVERTTEVLERFLDLGSNEYEELAADLSGSGRPDYTPK